MHIHCNWSYQQIPQEWIHSLWDIRRPSTLLITSKCLPSSSTGISTSCYIKWQQVRSYSFSVTNWPWQWAVLSPQKDSTHIWIPCHCPSGRVATTSKLVSSSMMALPSYQKARPTTVCMYLYYASFGQSLIWSTLWRTGPWSERPGPKNGRPRPRASNTLGLGR